MPTEIRGRYQLEMVEFGTGVLWALSKDYLCVASGHATSISEARRRLETELKKSLADKSTPATSSTPAAPTGRRRHFDLS